VNVAIETVRGLSLRIDEDHDPSYRAMRSPIN